MGKIRILPPQEAQKIAAGEVVERPANVVKEILENALDAGSLHTSLLLFEGGKKSITIIDNGCGMSPDDARLAIHNHATSKLQSVDELQAVATFGFRGEALASIAAVSHMIITTKTIDSDQGIKLTIADGTIQKEEPVACNTGTTIEIKDLFYNLPARKKFLKKEETEWNAIYHMFQALCLAHRDRSFTLFHNDNRSVHAPAVNTLQERFAQIFDTQLAAQMMSCTTKNDDQKFSITGVISHPSHHRYDRNQLFFFVNNRWIKNHKLAQALLKGYASVLPPQRYPSAAIFITINPELVDINIHPRKEEVQFLHPRLVEDALQQMVHTALQQKTATDLGAKKVFFTKPSQPFQAATVAPPQGTSTWTWGKRDSIPAPHIVQIADSPMQAAEPTLPELQQSVFHETAVHEQQIEYRLIGQILDTYIIIENNEGMLLIDQHAAHERILYELFAHRFQDVATIQLMFPQLVTLAPADYAVVAPWLKIFHANGIVVESLNDHQLVVKALPTHLKNAALDEFFKAAVGWVNESSALDPVEFHKLINDKLRAMMACKAAIKAGDQLDERQMHELIEKLQNCDHRMTCPHGRPTTWKVSRSDIERKFKRIE